MVFEWVLLLRSREVERVGCVLTKEFWILLGLVLAMALGVGTVIAWCWGCWFDYWLFPGTFFFLLDKPKRPIVLKLHLVRVWINGYCFLLLCLLGDFGRFVKHKRRFGFEILQLSIIMTSVFFCRPFFFVGNGQIPNSASVLQ